MQHVCKSCKCDSSILRHCMRERGGEEEEGKKRKRGRSRSWEPAQVRRGRKRQEGGAVVCGLSSRGGLNGGGGEGRRSQGV